MATYLRLVRECLRFPTDLVLSTAGAAGMALSGLRLAWLLKEWTEGPILGRDLARAGALGSQALAWTILLAACIFVSRYFTARLSQKLIEALRCRAAARLLRSRVSSARAYPAGELLSRVFTDVAAAGVFADTGFRRLVEDLVLLGGALAMMFVLDVKLALATCVIAAGLGALVVGIGSTIRRSNTAAHAAIAQVSGALTEQIGGLTTIKAFGAEAREQARFAGLQRQFRERMLRVESWSAALQGIMLLATGAALIAGMTSLSRRLSRGDVTPAEILSLFVYAGMTIEPLRRLANVHDLLQRSLAAVGRVFEIIDLPDPEEVHRGRSLPLPVRGDLALERLVFSYRAGTPVLEGLQLHIGAGEHIAVAGESGAGKSTLARLLSRHESPRAGRILLDGVDIQVLRLGDLRRAICVVEQEPFLFGATLLDNVRYGSPQSPPEEVERAVRAAGLEPLAGLLPRGLASTVAEAGRSLSGGERQRVALARAILRDPPILVLDEATNALDDEAEAEIFRELQGWLARRTVILFAHRLSTVARMPRVAVLQGGRIVEDGSAEELLATGPAFASLFSGQTSIAPAETREASEAR